MTTQHTPGTWNFHTTAGDHQFAIYSEADETGKDLALVYNRNENSKADAKLLAAAPDLLAALKNLHTIVMQSNDRSIFDNSTRAEIVAKAYTAIQRATNP